VTDAALGSVLEAGSFHVIIMLLPTPETTKFDIKAHDESISLMRKNEPNTNWLAGLTGPMVTIG
jgi:hypothetical protein